MNSNIGLVLSGGGAFGAWETGALRCFFDWWRSTFGEEPPIQAVVGTSTGALVSPFALLGRPPDHDYIGEVCDLYGKVTNAKIRAERPELILSPAAFFLRHVASVYDPGYDDDPKEASLLYKLLLQMIPEDRVKAIGDLWNSGRRLGVATLDFATGRPHVVTNSPEDLQILVKGILASAMAPLALPPVLLPFGSAGPTPHMDGGLYAEAPIAALFELAWGPPSIALTHVVVISSFPWFPSDDSNPVQGHDFPADPTFGSIGDRMNALMSEANASKDTLLASAAIELRKAGLTEPRVFDVTGYHIPGMPQLIKLFPSKRLGWQAFEFVPAEMKAMQMRGCQEAAAVLGAAVDCSGF
jgi:predicted acylesterase/phospholipase RssA